MVWRKRGKFGVHSSGRTLRAHIPKYWFVKKPFCPPFKTCFSAAIASNCWLDVSVRHGKDSIQEVLKKSDFQDGLGLLDQNVDEFEKFPNEIPPNSQVHRTEYQGLKSVIGLSLNKKKRWLLPRLLKQYVSDKSHEEKPPDLPVVTLVERNLLDREIVGNKADCLSIYTSGSGSGKTEKHCKSKYAQMTDLRKEVGLDEDKPEICYEVSYPFPNNSRPLHLENKPWMCSGREEILYKKGSKGPKKVRKFRRSEYRKNLTKEIAEIHEEEYVIEPHEMDDVLDERPRTQELPLSCFISSKKVGRNRKKRIKNNVFIENRAQKYGKGDAFVIEMENTVECVRDGGITSNSVSVRTIPKLDEPIPACIDLAVDPISICAKELHSEFKGVIEFSHTVPERFAIDLFPKMRSLNVNLEEFTAKLLFDLPLKANEQSLSMHVKTTVLLRTKSSPLISVTKSLCHHLRKICDSKSLPLRDIVNESVSFLSSAISPDGLENSPQQFSAQVTLPLSTVHRICNVQIEIVEPSVVLEKLADNGCSSECGKCTLRGSLVEEDGDDECGVCFTNKNGTDVAFTCLKECCHWFCDHCWMQHIKTQLEQSQINITCPEFKCKSQVNDTFVLSMVPDMYPQYKQWRNQSVITQSRNHSWCPGKECQRVAALKRVPNSMGMVPVACICGEVWCADCQEKAHWPAPCDLAHAYREKLKLFGINNNTIRIKSVFVKRCPKCNYPIDKKGGCQHMVCKCGHEFCWECLSDYWTHDWEKCKKLSKELTEVTIPFFSGTKQMNQFLEILLTNHKAWSDAAAMNKTYKDLGLLEQNLEAYRILTSKNFTATPAVSRKNESLMANNAVEVCYKGLDFKYQAHFILQNLALTISMYPKHKLKRRIKVLFESLQFNVEVVDKLLNDRKKLADPQVIKHLEKLVKSGEDLIKKMKCL